MIIDAASLKNTPTALSFSIEPDEIDLEGESIKLKDAVGFEGYIKKGIAQTDVEGKISTVIEVECSRCLLDAEINLDFSFEAVFVSPEYYTQEKEAELKTDDLEVSILENEQINLTELAREQVLLNVPTQVFCHEDCKGLCQKCGANRNLIDCNCEEIEIDPRWQGLRELKNKN